VFTVRDNYYCVLLTSKVHAACLHRADVCVESGMLPFHSRQGEPYSVRSTVILSNSRRRHFDNAAATRSVHDTYYVPSAASLLAEQGRDIASFSANVKPHLSSPLPSTPSTGPP
jgi:hypothetical protein